MLAQKKIEINTSFVKKRNFIYFQYYRYIF
ncbi:hypothetical protein X274_04260 [Marinitoga sp. 1155]|nr:hypothetical protein X274_04260 [Marinitoga sp. 1155]